ncbi:OmpA family protein [Entomomonas asaccharolytica]|uniref:OmpA family protein n=1 Tax=Entomomonas asaccharolytica TaxID=2785331 RepID=A0A974NI17_9GAMM|nr:OmpA family protein [Entomomonas asaccharolytica]QQP87013.1 OmpA family protein [Entomomonas asaccharolytica]
MPIFNSMKVVTVGVLLTSLLTVTGCSNPEPQQQVVEVKRGGVTYTSTSINEAMVKQAIAGSKFEMETRGDSIVIVMPVKASFNAKRQDVLLPVTLTPLTKIAKLVKQDSNSVVVIVGHTDDTGGAAVNNELSLKRAKSVGSVFNVAGLPGRQVYSTGVGSNQPLTTNKTAKGREQNRRVELIIVQKQDRDIATLANLYAVTNYQNNN